MLSKLLILKWTLSSFKQIIIDELLRYKKLGYPNFIFVHPFLEELITYIILLIY
jgi:hypothetical protein